MTTPSIPARALHRFNVANSSYQFNGSTSYIELPDAGIFATPDYTVSLWFNAFELPKFADHDHEAAILISKGRNDFELHLGAPPYSDSGVRFLPRLVDSNTGQAWDGRSAAVSAGVWHNVIATYDGSANAARIFLDGVETPLDYLSGSDALEPSVAARLGMRYDGTVPFKGQLDEIRIYDRALSSVEAFALFEFERHQNVPEFGSSGLMLAFAASILIKIRNKRNPAKEDR